MSRRQDHEGVPRHEVQLRRNLMMQAEYDRRGTNDRGWHEPFAVWQRWDALGQAIWWTRYRLIILRDLLTPYERKDIVRRVRLCLQEARQCARPQLPS